MILNLRAWVSQGRGLSPEIASGDSYGEHRVPSVGMAFWELFPDVPCMKKIYKDK